MIRKVSPFASAAMFLHQLREMEPGQSYRVDQRRLLDMQVPASPLDRQDCNYLTEWFRARLPFRCTVTESTERGYFEFHRPKEENAT